MDARKALFRAKLREQKKEKRIDSPLVRYNEYDQPVCRVCNVTLKSDSQWSAHQVSRKHHEAIEDLKAKASGKNHATVTKSDPPKELCKSQPSATVPADFFDKHERKRPKFDGKTEASCSGPVPVNGVDESVDAHLVEAKKKLDGMASDQLSQQRSRNLEGLPPKQVKGTLPKVPMIEKKSLDQLNETTKPTVSDTKQVKGTLPEGFFDTKAKNENRSQNQPSQSSKVSGLEAKHVQGALPEGFFDNKDADLRARGIKPVKVDINDAYKEFEKEIHDDLQEVDDRLEEEEIDAAEVREEFESLEQKEYRERVEMVKKRLIEAKAARHAKGQQPLAFKGQESSDESSSDSDNEDENFIVDWRAKHL